MNRGVYFNYEKAFYIVCFVVLNILSENTIFIGSQSLCIEFVYFEYIFCEEIKDSEPRGNIMYFLGSKGFNFILGKFNSENMFKYS